MLRATRCARIMQVITAQVDLRNPLTAKDRPVQSFTDEFLRPPRYREMEAKYGKYARYADPEFARLPDIDKREEIVLNTYPEGATQGLIADEKNFKYVWDEEFFRQNILKKASTDEYKHITLDYALNCSILALFIMAFRYVLAPIYYIGLPRSTLFADSNIEAEIGTLEHGECKTIVWRGKPIYVYHRSPKVIADMDAVPMSELKHPETDEARFPTRRSHSVVIAICTHLGCVPHPNDGVYNGYFCPCHGSHYDLSGRIRLGPAPLNLEPPSYKWLDDNTIYIGKL